MITQGGLYCDHCKQPVQASVASIVIHLSLDKILHFHYFCLAQLLNRKEGP
ncbi:MAG TPA: hypothetical protein VKR52_04740 [Terracidiphilus sp.]|nr:hypothetical protein [Terracidiphilus sp.]